MGIVQLGLRRQEGRFLPGHEAAQALRNELSARDKRIAALGTELAELQDHVHFLRHISAPTPDAGALDAQGAQAGREPADPCRRALLS